MRNATSFIPIIRRLWLFREMKYLCLLRPTCFVRIRLLGRWIFLNRCGAYSMTGRSGFSSELGGGSDYPKALAAAPSRYHQFPPDTPAGRRYRGPRSITPAPLDHRPERRPYKPYEVGSIPSWWILPLRISAKWRK